MYIFQKYWRSYKRELAQGLLILFFDCFLLAFRNFHIFLYDNNGKDKNNFSSAAKKIVLLTKFGPLN